MSWMMRPAVFRRCNKCYGDDGDTFDSCDWCDGAGVYQVIDIPTPSRHSPLEVSQPSADSHPSAPEPTPKELRHIRAQFKAAAIREAKAERKRMREEYFRKRSEAVRLEKEAYALIRATEQARTPSAWTRSILSRLERLKEKC